jgi:3-deoxy-manno-octulosonate cytidylyltransferase (CMP-KDO synthetase)
VEDFFNPNVVKVVCDARGRALYFSRAPIPGTATGLPARRGAARRLFRRVAISAVCLSRRFSAPFRELLEPRRWSASESLEQVARALAWLSDPGGDVAHRPAPGVDTPRTSSGSGDCLTPAVIRRNFALKKSIKSL